MNIISLAISMFISNIIIIRIINYLPFRNKRAWSIGVISFYDGGGILGYLSYLLYTIFNGDINTMTILYMLEDIGSIIGIIVAYIASLMMILDNVRIFKSRRLREYERGLKNEDGKSVPRQIFGLISLIISLGLGIYLIFTILNYNKEILFSVIGAAAVFLLFVGLTIYFFVTGKSLHKKITAPALILQITLPDFSVLFEADLSKDFTIADALNGLDKEYLLDELGLLITPDKKYLVKGINVQSIKREHITNLKMQRITSNKFDLAFKEFKKYARMKIVLDENNQITKISSIR